MNLPVVATGRSREGVRWELRGGPMQDEEFGTFLDVETERGLVGRGGHLGPVLAPGAVTSISVHRWSPGTSMEGGIHYVVGRVRADVARVQLQLVGVRPPTRDLVPVGRSEELQVAFVADVLPSGADLVHIAAFDREGRKLEDRGCGIQAALLSGRIPPDIRRET
jgi:hypothetical protein